MSGISGKVRTNNFEPQELEVGLFTGVVKLVNPSIEEYKEVLGIELKEESRAAEYLGESKDGNTTLRVDFWLEQVKKEGKFKKVTFFLENKEKSNKDGSKKQYINSLGSCSWADEEENLPEWFKQREYRVAYVGEEEFYGFLRTWLGKLDYKDTDTVLSLNWKNLMKGNLKEIKEQIDGEFTTPVVAMATVVSKEKDGEYKEYQGVWNKMFLPEYTLKQFRVVDYHKPEVQEALKKKKSSDLKPHERFVVTAIGEYGIKDTFLFKDIKEYNPDDFLTGSEKVLDESSPEY